MSAFELVVDDLVFEVRRSARRKTLQITVDRDGELIISAPEGVDESLLAHFVREKRFWIYTKLAEKDAIRTPVGRKEYVSGEGFKYLGRSYRLLLVDEQDRPLKLEAGRFRLLRAEVENGRAHFVRWYTDHGRRWLGRRVKLWTPRLGEPPKGVEVRDLGYRWGSCGKGGTLNFHWATMILPPSLVDYVIVHELAHLQEPNHTPEFWQIVERAMPDFEQRKGEVAASGSQANCL
jgi:predicted metal-dependent hydrolase